MNTDSPDDPPQAPQPQPRTNIQAVPDHTEEEVEGLRERLGLLRETLRHHLKQLAIMGSAYTPPHVMHGIREARREIARLKKSLRDWGVAIADHPDDER